MRLELVLLRLLRIKNLIVITTFFLLLKLLKELTIGPSAPDYDGLFKTSNAMRHRRRNITSPMSINYSPEEVRNDNLHNTTNILVSSNNIYRNNDVKNNLTTDVEKNDNIIIQNNILVQTDTQRIAILNDDLIKDPRDIQRKYILDEENDIPVTNRQRNDNLNRDTSFLVKLREELDNKADKVVSKDILKNEKNNAKEKKDTVETFEDVINLDYVNDVSDAIETKEKVKSGNIDHFVPSSLKKIDWHDYEQIRRDLLKSGPGEQGAAVQITDVRRKSIEMLLIKSNGFNASISDRIALNRSIPDIRHPKCRDRLYIESLPTVSVVVPFHNEHWSTLLRTVYSVLMRTPEHLLIEILLVDDASTKQFLGEDLDFYIGEHTAKVHIIRPYTGERRGLVSARLVGAEAATGDVLVFLDSHSEVNVNWLPPLLEPIAFNHRTVVCPLIDVISHDTFEYHVQDEGGRGAFDWSFMYRRLPLARKDVATLPDPYDNPVMAGGYFAMSRAFFWELGGYDPGIMIWGAEQFELSFKVWQCGGRMVDAPCSRVGHVYRKFSPFPDPHLGDFLRKNNKRVAEVWMDEYAKYMYNRYTEYNEIDPGDLSAQRAVRERLKCKPFKWFMTEIAYDFTKFFPLDPKKIAEGRLTHVMEKGHCVDFSTQNTLVLVPCTEEVVKFRQYYELHWRNEIRLYDTPLCWDVGEPDSNKTSPVVVQVCATQVGPDKRQSWIYLEASQHILHSSGRCLDFSPSSRLLLVAACRHGAGAQQWRFDTLHARVLRAWYHRHGFTDLASPDSIPTLS